MSRRNGFINASDFLAAITVQPVSLDVPHIGRVQVRGLTLLEMQSIGETIKQDNRLAAIEAIGMAMESPKLTTEQIHQLDEGLRAGGIDTINIIASRIFELSALAGTEADEGEESPAEALEKKAGSGS